MKLEFDRNVDAAYLEISDEQVVLTKQVEPGVIADFDAWGQLVGVEVLSMSKLFPSD